MKSLLKDCRLIKLPKVQNRAGNLSFIESNLTIPFTIRRIYYLYDIPGGEERGGHAHKNLFQLIIAASGSFKVILDNGEEMHTIMMNHPDKGLLIIPGIWREIKDFSSGAICLVFASELYNENDYIRNYTDFINFY